MNEKKMKKKMKPTQMMKNYNYAFARSKTDWKLENKQRLLCVQKMKKKEKRVSRTRTTVYSVHTPQKQIITTAADKQ